QQGVYSEDFASYLEPDGRGITTENLTRAARDRGWSAVPFAGSVTQLQSAINDGRPIVALIEQRPGRFHFVVVIGWTGGRVVVHDRAVRSNRTFTQARWERLWSGGQHWALLVLPPSPRPSTAVTIASPTLDTMNTTGPTGGHGSGACGPLIAEGIALAEAGDL